MLLEWTDVEKLEDYSILQKFTYNIFNNPEFFTSASQVNVFNSLPVNHLAGAMSNNIKKYWFNIPAFGSIGNTGVIYPQSVIYYNRIESNDPSLETLRQFFTWDFIQTSTPKYSSDLETTIEIIIGLDHEDAFSF